VNRFAPRVSAERRACRKYSSTVFIVCLLARHLHQEIFPSGKIRSL
jgi:hypothetical protein